MTAFSKFQCLSLAMVIAAVASAPVRGAEPPAAASAPDGKQAFRDGLVRYEAGDYAGAIASWTTARTQMGTDPQARDAWHVLGFDLGQAHVRAYRLDHDVAHFGPATQLLDEYIAWVDRPEHTMSEAEREDRPRALEMLEFIDHERTVRLAAIAPAPAPVVVATSAAIDRPVLPVDAGARDRKLRASRAMIASGAIGLGLGLGSAVIVGVLASRGPKNERDYEATQAQIGNEEPTAAQSADLAEIDARGRRINAGVIAAAACTAVFIPVGIGLLAGGLVKRKHALRMSPAVAPGYAGAGLSLRF